MRESPKIGIIGGAGVAAGAELLARLEHVVTGRGAFRDSHHPEVILYQATQAPSRSMFLEGRGATFITDYIDVGTKLKQAGATFIGMCCNTAHAGWKEIQAGVGLPFINLIEEAIRSATAQAPGARTIGVVCSDGTRAAQLYEKTTRRLGLLATILQPDTAIQADVTLGICNIKRGFHRTKTIDDPARPFFLYRRAVAHLIDAGADVVILGCTEVPLDFNPTVVDGRPIVDCIDVLALRCLDLHEIQSARHYDKRSR